MSVSPGQEIRVLFSLLFDLMLSLLAPIWFCFSSVFIASSWK